MDHRNFMKLRWSMTPINTRYLLYNTVVAWQFTLSDACFLLYFVSDVKLCSGTKRGKDCVVAAGDCSDDLLLLLLLTTMRELRQHTTQCSSSPAER